jgi:ABC-2 type transport system ATP-binding protein
MDAMIRFEEVTKRYGSLAALSNLSFEVEKGKFYGFLGPNGAGKTTTIKSIIGLVHPDEGNVYINDIDVSRDPLAVRSIVGYVPDTPFIYGKLSGREFLRFVGGLYRMDNDDLNKRIEWVCDIFEMHGWIDRRAEEYSHGMKKKTVMSAAFLHRPQVIIVDEPTTGLDPPSARLLKDMLKLIQQHGTTIFLSSHDLSVITELCEKMAIIHKGTIAAEGTLSDLRKKAEMEGGNLEDLFMKLTENVTKAFYME